MPGDSNSNVELASFGQELNGSYENVLARDSSHRSKFKYLKAFFNGVLLFGLATVVIYLLAKSDDSKEPLDLTKQLINVTDSKLLYQMKQKSMNEEQIINQLINVMESNSKVLLEMKQSMMKASSMLFRMIRLTPAEFTNQTNENTNDVPEIQLDIGDFSQCFEKGICMEAHLLDVTKIENVSSCMEMCQSDDQCQWASFDLEFQFCTLYKDCPKRWIDKTHSKYITSKVNCPLEIPCNVTGRCEGPIRTLQVTNHECHEKCGNDINCNWYSIGDNLCIMYRSCLKIDTIQSNFTTQHVTCPEGTIFQSSCSK